MSDLVTIRTRGGAAFTVERSAAPKFEALLNDLEASGYAIRPNASGGYNYRTIAGTNRLSNHAFGRAIDVNWDTNPLGGKGDIDPAVARSLAQKHGMVWGGDWRRPDPMHFEVGGEQAPATMAARSLVAHAGLKPAEVSPAVAPIHQTGYGRQSPTPTAAPVAASVATSNPVTSSMASLLPFKLSLGGGGDEQSQIASEARATAAAQSPEAKRPSEVQLPQPDLTRLAAAIQKRQRLGV